MKNKEFIKKSIEENIVDHTTVLNNLKAKASVIEAERAYKQPARVGLRKAAVFAMVAVLCVTCVFSSIYLFSGGAKDTLPPVIPGTTLDASGEPNNSNQHALSAASEDSSVSNKNPQSGTSHEPKGDSSSGGIITDIPLDDETKAFFDGFSENFTVLQNLIHARLETGSENNGYAQITDARFNKLSDIRDFLYTFMLPETAGQIFVNLTSGITPNYVEKDGTLYQRIDAKNDDLLEIQTETAFLKVKNDNALIINAMLKPSDGSNYYQRFEFEKVNDVWLYKPVLSTNNTNNR